MFAEPLRCLPPPPVGTIVGYDLPLEIYVDDVISNCGLELLVLQKDCDFIVFHGFGSSETGVAKKELQAFISSCGLYIGRRFIYDLPPSGDPATCHGDGAWIYPKSPQRLVDLGVYVELFLKVICQPIRLPIEVSPSCHGMMRRVNVVLPVLRISIVLLILGITRGRSRPPISLSRRALSS